MFKLVYTAQARKDYQKAKNSPLRAKVEKLLALLENNPLQTPPPFKRLTGDLNGALSRRIDQQHRLVYEILDNDADFKTPSGELYKGIVKTIRLWTHYE
jgi:Txe/YoeB family toxin of toxin-antitoxin system